MVLQAHKDDIKDSESLNRMTSDMAISAKFFGLGEINHGCSYLVRLRLPTVLGSQPLAPK
jgi:hypothetical protein